MGPVTYRVGYDTQDWESTGNSDQMPKMYGYTDHRQSVILLHPQTSPGMLPVVFLHELMHAVAFTAGAVDTRDRPEEDWVVMVSPMLLDTLRRNPKVTAFLLGGPP